MLHWWATPLSWSDKDDPPGFISEDAALYIAYTLGIGQDKAIRLPGGTAAATFELRPFFPKSDPSLLMKVARRDNPREAEKLEWEIRHLAKGRELAKLAQTESLVIPTVERVVDVDTHFGFIAEWLPGHRFADLFHQPSIDGASPSGLSRYTNNLLLDLRKVWNLGVDDDRAKAREFAQTMYVDRPLQAVQNSLAVQGGSWLRDVTEGPIIVNGLERRNPLEILSSVPDWLLDAVRLRPCISGDLTVNNLKAMPDWKIGVYDPRGYCPTMELGGSTVPVLDPAYDIAKLLMGMTGWLESSFGEVSLERIQKNEFEMRYQSSGVDRRKLEGLVNVVTSSFDALLQDVKGETIGALAMLALGAHYVTEASHRLRENPWRDPKEALVTHLLGTMVLSELDESLGTEFFDPSRSLKELRLETWKATERPDEFSQNLSPLKFDNFTPPTDADY